MGIDEAGLALAAVRALPGSNGELAAKTLRELAARYGISAVAAALRRS
jgi:hypothetical protein